MTMWRLPVFTWDAVVTALLGLVAFPPAVAAFVLLLFDRRLGGQAFDPPGAATRSCTSTCSGSSATRRSTS